MLTQIHLKISFQPLAVEMYMITCLLQSFSSTIYDTHANTWSEPDATGKLVTISKNSVHHFQKRCISLLYFFKNSDLTNEKASIFMLYNNMICRLDENPHSRLCHPFSHLSDGNYVNYHEICTFTAPLS